MPRAPKKLTNSDRIRQSVLKAARKIFLQRGYDATLDEVAAEADVARRTLYYIYGSKEKLFLSVIEVVVDLSDLFVRLDPDRDVRETLLEFAHNYVGRVLNKEALAFHRLLITEQSRFPKNVRTMAETEIERLTSPLQRYFAAISDKGRVGPIPPQVAAEQFLSMLIGHARMNILFGLPRPRAAERTHYVETVVDIFLNGISHFKVN